ncbi:MAG: HlyD family efflux transporter periplasmic adaptor subunit [Betaproteobacteria bacterium]
MTTPLFRSEVTQSKQASWMGPIHLAHNPRFSIVAGLALVLAGALLAFGAWGKVARKVRVPGVLMPQWGTVELSPAISGVLLEQRVKEGDWVEQGQVLFVVNTDKSSAEGSTASLLASHLAQRRSTLLAERASRLAQNRQREVHLADRIHSLSVETAQATQEHALAKRRVELAQKTSARFEQMAAEGFVSDIQAQSKQEELIDLQARLENTLRNGLALSREQNAAEADLALLQKQLAIDLLQLERNLASLDQETAEIQSRKTSSVLAPQAGQVSTVHLSLGALAQAGQTIASLVPRTTSLVSSHMSSHLSSQMSTYAPDPSAHTLVAALFAPTRTAGFIQPGQEVWLRLAAYPYQKFGLAKGRVLKVSGTPIAPQDLPHGQGTALMASTQSKEPLYRIQVELASQHVMAFGQAHSLRPGMTLDADVIHDVRGIWEWVFEPLLAIHARQQTS